MGHSPLFNIFNTLIMMIMIFIIILLNYILLPESMGKCLA